MDADYVTVKFSRQLVERMEGRWSAPVQCKLVPEGDGCGMMTRYPGDEIPDAVVAAAAEELYGLGAADTEKFMNGTREALQAALKAWRP